MYIIPKENRSVNLKGREFLVVARARVGWGKGNIFFGGAFCEAKNEIRRRRNPSSRTLCVHYGARSEGGAGIPFPPTPFSSRPARARNFSALPHEARQSKFKIRIFVKKSSDFVQKVLRNVIELPVQFFTLLNFFSY